MLTDSLPRPGQFLEQAENVKLNHLGIGFLPGAKFHGHASFSDFFKVISTQGAKFQHFPYIFTININIGKC